jgi:abhydrolase domain-containing protein 17
LILEAPFTSASDVAGTALPILGPLLVRSYNSVPKIRRILAPKLFIQGDHDEIIPPRLCQALYAAAQSPKEFWVVEGAGHNNILEIAGPQYRQRLEMFYGHLAADER